MSKILLQICSINQLLLKHVLMDINITSSQIFTSEPFLKLQKNRMKFAIVLFFIIANSHFSASYFRLPRTSTSCDCIKCPSQYENVSTEVFGSTGLANNGFSGVTGKWPVPTDPVLPKTSVQGLSANVPDRNRRLSF